MNYKIQIKRDLKEIAEDGCDDSLISEDDIRISVKVNKKASKIYDLVELEKGILLDDVIDALETKNISIRIWVKQDSLLPIGANMHYHGIMQVIEGDTSIAIVE